jgi:SAM-dependent methyltransferase
MTQFRKEQFAGFVAGRGLGRKKIIEIGCGRGEYLSIMRQCDVEAFGLEHFDESVRHCAENGLNVQKGYIQSKYDALDNAPFDAFCMLNFLEHIPDPNTTMRGIYNNLSDDGVGLVEVPNFDMILRRNLFSEFMADHLCYFTKDTLAHTLRVNGFEIIECSEKWYDYMISVTVRKRTRTDLSCFESFKSALKTEVHEYMDRFEPNTVAIWGAGHQSLAVISLLELADRVKYVVDSAPFKQGKFTPATHIRIVSPETLRSKPVNAVIIMAASYSDEVAGIVRKEFDDKVNLAILRDYGLEII